MARPDAAGFLRPGVNMVELPGRAPAEAVLALLRESRGAGSQAAPEAIAGRRTVLEGFSEATVVPRHLAEIMDAWQAARPGPARA